jgi:hypothetical protein
MRLRDARGPSCCILPAAPLRQPRRFLPCQRFAAERAAATLSAQSTLSRSATHMPPFSAFEAAAHFRYFSFSIFRRLYAPAFIRRRADAGYFAMLIALLPIRAARAPSIAAASFICQRHARRSFHYAASLRSRADARRRSPRR